jgi:hypothetical protein
MAEKQASWMTRFTYSGLSRSAMIVTIANGVYSSELEANAAMERVKDQKGFASFPQGFRIN